MKKKLGIAVLVTVIAGIVLLLLGPWKNGTTSEQNRETFPAEEKVFSDEQTRTPNTTDAIAPLVTNSIADDSDRSRLPEIVQKYDETHNVPIHFYGQIIDQDSNPVPDVKIAIAIQQSFLKSPTSFDVGSKVVRTELKTGIDGRFEIRGEKGSAFDIETISKEGYELSPRTLRSSGPVGGSATSPVVYRMWKKMSSPSLVTQDADTRIPYNGTPVTFDLLTGEKKAATAQGDIRVTLTRNPLQVPVGYEKPFEWHAIIEAIDGGLIQSDDDFMYAAPAEGYQPRINIDMPADATTWSNIYNISFYAKTRNGQVYSRVKLAFRVDSQKAQTGFTITSAANPSGSRDLESVR